MKLWLSKSSEIPMREQLVTQITLGIASGDLKIGEKLPSRGEISRRFDIHANTVSGAYQKLEEKGLIEFRRGSGFFVCEIDEKQFGTGNELDGLISNFIIEAIAKGFSRDEIKSSFENYFSQNSTQNFIIVETDESLRKILIDEIKTATGIETDAISFIELISSFLTIALNI